MKRNIFLKNLKVIVNLVFFFENFINHHESIDLYQIPNLFLEEYLSILSRTYDPNSMNNYKIKFFNIFENMYNKKQSQKINIDFNPFLSEYFKKYKNYFERDIMDFNYEGKNIVKYSNLKKNLKYQWYELDNELLLKYILFTKSLDSIEYERLFNLNVLLNENISKKIKINDIEDEIEKEILTDDFYNNGLSINDDDICCINIILLISISLQNIDDKDLENYISIAVGSLLKNFFMFRKYYYILIDMIHRIISYELNENQLNKNRLNILLSFYYPCLNSILDKNIIPNEKIARTISNMYEIEHTYKNKDIFEHDLICEKKDKNKSKPKYIIFTSHNYSHDKILKEKELIKCVNKDDAQDKNNWKNHLGFIVRFNCGIKTILIIPKIKLIGRIKKNENDVLNLSLDSEIFSQRLIKNILNEEYQKFIKNNMNIYSLDVKKIMTSILNIFVYVKNSSKYEEKTEIIKAVQLLLDHYINNYLIK